jgi:rod shape-determining protein MreD
MAPPLVAQPPLRRLDQTARRLLPVLTATLLCIFATLPIGLPHWGALAPPLMLAAVYYWALARPDLMPPAVAFMLGIFQDLLTGAPIGSGALIMVLTQWIMRGQQRFLANRPFLLMWAGFLPLAAMATALEWLVYAAFSFHAVPITGGLARMVLGFVLFPVVAWAVLIPVHRILPQV